MVVRGGMVENTNKICRKCNTEKPLSDFYKHGKYYASYCKQCHRIETDKWKHNHKEIVLQIAKKSRNKNKEKVYKYHKLYTSLPKRKEYKKNYDKKYYAKNKESISIKAKYYYQNNKDKYRKYSANKRIKDLANPKLKLHRNISCAVYLALKGKKDGKRVTGLLGYSITTLYDHLERQFLTGMTWSNYGNNGWHIDHKIPISVFNFETPDDIDFKKCWSLDNLQPMWHLDNIKKADKLDQPFQPSLLLEVK